MLTDIGTLGGRDTVLGSAPLNDRGQVVGLSQTAPDSSVAHAFLWQQGEMRDLGTLGGENSVATAINSSGQIAGWSGTAGGETHAFIWKNGVMKDIGTLGGTTSMAEGINEHGDVVGESTTATGEQRVFLWRNGVMKDLGTPVAGGDVQAEAVNDAGDVIASAIVGRARGSFFSSHGVATMIESFGGVSTTVQALNNRGQVVGGSQGADGNYHAFQWHKGKMTDLGTLGGGSFSFAAAENDSGTVAGSGDTEGGHMHGFVWSHGELIDLGTPGNDSFANAINERGDVAGSSGDDATLWVRNG